MLPQISEDQDTLLVLSGMGVPRYSARGITQTLEAIDEAKHIERAINGGLIDFGYAPFRKYKTTITGDDQRPPAVEGVWPGKIITVDCVAELSVVQSMPLERTPVPGSEYIEDGYVFYRPRLVMMVFGFQMTADEWKAGVGWSLNAEEV
jgi:hypothetical protein